MGKMKETLKLIGMHAWEIFKSALLPMFFYGMLSSVCFMGTVNEEWTGDIAEGLNGSRIAWVVIVALAAAAYHGFLSYASGGKGYEMLVSGNMKRISAQQLGSSYKISSHKEVQEYRAWKGFASGAIIAVFTLLFGILMGANGTAINEVMVSLTAEAEEVATKPSALTAAIALTSMLLSGWSVLPFVFLNIGGATVSYYWSCLFALIPILVSGVLYIAGAYGKRAKTIKAQEEADRAAAAAAAKPKKINYGGLPGTKPKKRKK